MFSNARKLAKYRMVLNESSEALGIRSEIVRILVLAMTIADDSVSGSNFV